MLRRGEIDGVDGERVADRGRDTAQQQALRPPLPVVGAQQRLGLANRRLRPVTRAVVDQLHLACLAGGHVAFEIGVDYEHNVEFAAANQAS